MNVKELESEVSQLAPAELAQFSQWFEKFLAEQWDRQLEKDVAAGRLDSLVKQADAAFEAGHCTPL